MLLGQNIFEILQTYILLSLKVKLLGHYMKCYIYICSWQTEHLHMLVWAYAIYIYHISANKHPMDDRICIKKGSQHLLLLKLYHKKTSIIMGYSLSAILISHFAGI